MKFFTLGKLLSRVENHDYNLIMGASIAIPKRGYIKKDNWGRGWIYDADESFRSWCIISYGFDPIHVFDTEYNLLEIDGIVHLSVERTLVIKKAYMSQLSIIAVNS